MDFHYEGIANELERCSDETLDGLPFGVIRMTRDGLVNGFNAYEVRLAGLSRSRVVGKHFFTEVAPCTNNALVAQRYEECLMLDERLPYVFTLRMRPRKVELRLLKVTDSAHQYLLVRNR